MVKRFTELGYQRVRGEYVKYTDYAELERQRDALVSENAALKSATNYLCVASESLVDCVDGLDRLCDVVSAGVNKVRNIDSPATDAALREIGAKAVEKCAESLLANDDISVDYEYQAIKAFAQQLREGKV
ncbi:hypothetical protein [Pectobacterium aroidearum]|uniref:hypothetical protein n=1 Tax=Pectobacterium aroidearum TaxID=1201031 RepID=UPI001CD1952D|nr:hypothetical protein [Pectobacterium aroidearum]